MSIIREEKENRYFNIKLEVCERQKGEMREPWKIISLEFFDDFEDFSPKQLRGLGKWLIKQGKRIGKEYTSKGRKREIKELPDEK